MKMKINEMKTLTAERALWLLQHNFLPTGCINVGKNDEGYYQFVTTWEQNQVSGLSATERTLSDFSVAVAEKAADSVVVPVRPDGELVY